MVEIVREDGSPELRAQTREVITGIMGGELAGTQVDLANEGLAAETLIAVGWRARTVGELLDGAIAAADRIRGAGR